MSDESLQEQENVEEVVETKVEPKTDAKQETKKGDKQDKKFTDADMANLRRSLSKQHSEAETAWNTEKETMQARLDAQDATITKMVDLLKKDVELPEDFAELLEEKSPSEQLEFLLKQASKVTDIPRTPQGKGDRNHKFVFKHNISRI